MNAFHAQQTTLKELDWCRINERHFSWVKAAFPDGCPSCRAWDRHLRSQTLNKFVDFKIALESVLRNRP